MILRPVCIAALCAVAFAPTVHADEPQPIAFPEALTSAVLTLPTLRQGVVDARVDSEAAFADAVLALRQADRYQERANQAQSTVTSFARNTYMAGMPNDFGIAMEALDGGIGSMLHDWSVQRHVGNDRALHAVGALDEARSAHARAQSRVNTANMAHRALIGREQHLQATEAFIARRTADLGYPDLALAALSLDVDGCATLAPSDANPDGVDIGALCQAATGHADDSGAAAIRWGFARLGAPYACEGIGRDHPLFRFDCSSFVSRAYQDGAGIALWSGSFIPTTATMLDGGSRFRIIDVTELRSGDLVVYQTCRRNRTEVIGEVREESDDRTPDEAADSCDTQHVVMYLGRHANRDWMIHTGTCGGGVTVEGFWGVDEDEPGRQFLAVVRPQPVS